MGTRETLHRLVASLIEDQGGTVVPADSEPLLRNGALDSLSVMKIAIFMEKEFGVDFSDLYFDQNDFASVAAMVSFVERRGAGRP